MNDYADKQKQRDAQYAQAWEKLTPAQRRQMAKHGITGPDLPRYETHKRECDTPETAEAIAEREGQCTVSFASPVYSDEDHPRLEHALDALKEEFAMDALRRLLGNLICDDNTRLSLECLCYVTRVGYNGDTETQIAKRHNISRAAVSKRCIQLCKRMRIKPPAGMRSLTSRRHYAKAQLNRD